ncbi:MAG: diguanylate cyclase [Clostridia bacterium]|nr:diguanylate cyclase [Clostridia bacterium]
MRKFKKFRVTIFILIFLLTLSSIAIFSMLISSNMKSLATKKAYEDITYNDNALRDQIDQYMLNVESLVSQMANSSAVINEDYGEVDRMSQTLINNFPLISQLFITDTIGMQIYKSSFTETLGDRSDRDYFQQAVSGKAVFSDVIISRSTNDPTVVHAQPVYRNGKIDGVIGVSINLKLLSNLTLLSYAPTDSKAYGYIVDSTGLIISHPNPDFVNQSLDLAYLSPVASVMTGQTGTGIYIFQKTEKLVAFTPSMVTNWGVLYQIPKDEAFNTVYIINNLLIINMIFVIFGALFATIMITRFLEKPIKKITHLISNIADKKEIDNNYQISYNEFGFIESELISMYVKIKKTQNSLEEKVKERTEELTVTMNKLVKTQKELISANKKLRGLALTDSLTGLPNRRSFDEYFKRFWNISKRNHIPGAILMIDIDYFKDFNDYHGHVAGDHCLKTISKKLSELLFRESDYLSRFGGEEFMILLNNVDYSKAEKKASMLVKEIHEMNYPHGGRQDTPVVSISIGVLCINDWDSHNREECLAKVDKIMYQAKEQGRNRYVIE